LSGRPNRTKRRRRPRNRYKGTAAQKKRGTKEHVIPASKRGREKIGKKKKAWNEAETEGRVSDERENKLKRERPQGKKIAFY